MIRALCILCLWFMINSTRSYGLLMESTLDDVGSSNELISCVERIANEYFTRKENVLIISGDSFIAGEMLHRIGPHFGINLADKKSRIDFGTVSDLIVFDDESTGNPYEAVENMIVNPRGRYVIVTRCDTENLENAAAKFWGAGIPKVIFLRASGEGTVEVFGYKISPQYQNYTKLCLLDIWKGEFLNTANLFANKFENMKKYPLIVAVMNNPGAEPDVYITRENEEPRTPRVASNLVNIFAEKLNFRIIIKEEFGYGKTLKNGTQIGFYGELLRGETDLACGALLPVHPIVWIFDHSNFYGWESVHFALKIKGRTVSWKSIFKPLSLDMWLIELAVLLATTGLVCIVQKFWSLNLLSEYVRHIDILKVLVNQGIPDPKRTGFRLALALWLIYGYLTTTSYTGRLVNYLSMPDYEKNLETVQELEKAGLEIVGDTSARDILEKARDSAVRRMRDRFVTLPYESISEALDGEKRAVMMFHTASIFHNWNYRLNESMWIYTINEPLISTPMFYFMKKGHPWREPLNHFIGHIHSSGLISKWMSDYDVHKVERKYEQGSVVLTLMHVASVFFILCSGYVISTLAFIYELYRR